MITQLLPKKNEFFDYFNEAADRAVEAAKVLRKMMDSNASVETLGHELKAIEHACDDVAHKTMELLNSTFITPIDREDIHQLILKIDDVVDLLNASGGRFVYFKVGASTPFAVRLADQLVHGCEKMALTVRALRNSKQYPEAVRLCIDIHEVENAGDEILHEALTHLFENVKDPIQVIKWKEIYEMMERATDRLEDVANVIQGMISKMS
ncbi:MAG: hypothetical protein PCFJNLEI_01305 [Verrucomicrobiae bacterium]|nr:hypothetical protein [Verrucomicrobiae bacterium]